MRIANTLPELIGRTPLLRLERFAPGGGLLARWEDFSLAPCKTRQESLAALEEAYQNWQADPKSLTLAMAGRHRAGERWGLSFM